MLLTALLVSLALPMVLSSVNGATSGMAERRMGEVAEDIARTVEGMAAAGPGNVRLMEVPLDLPGNARLWLGGANGSADCLRICWAVDGRQGSRYLEGVVVVTSGGGPLTLGAGDSLRLICPGPAWGLVEAARA